MSMYFENFYFKDSSKDKKSDIVLKLAEDKRITRRLLVPGIKFINLYKTERLPKYELRKIEFNFSDDLDQCISGLNFSINDEFGLLLNPIRVFIEKNCIYIGHLPSGLELEVSEFLVSYLKGIEEVIHIILDKRVEKYNYFSWDKLRKFKIPMMDKELDFCNKNLTLKKNDVYNKFYPEFSDKPNEERVSFFGLFRFTIDKHLIKYLMEEPE